MGQEEIPEVTGNSLREQKSRWVKTSTHFAGECGRERRDNRVWFSVMTEPGLAEEAGLRGTGWGEGGSKSYRGKHNEVILTAAGGQIWLDWTAWNEL